MKQKVIAKQPNSKMCYVCGMKNPKGLRASFYELENGEVVGLFHPTDTYQGYPDRLHGCIAAGLLDEAIGRAIRTRYDEEAMGQTAELKLADGTVAVEASGKYFSIIGDMLLKEELEAQEWKVYPAADDPRELDV